MPADNFADMIAGGCLLLFTGTDSIVSEGTIIEVVSKVGVVAVLWYWVQDMKKRLKEQLEAFDTKTTEIAKAFDKETDEIRQSYLQVIETLQNEHTDYKDRLDQIIQMQKEDIKDLRNTLITTLSNPA